MSDDIGPRYEALCGKKPELRVEGLVVLTLPGVEMWSRLDAGCVDTYHRLTRDEAHSLIAMRMIECLPKRSGIYTLDEPDNPFNMSIWVRGFKTTEAQTIIDCLLAFWENCK